MIKSIKSLYFGFLVVLGLSLAACGGGNSNIQLPPAGPTGAPAPTIAPTTAPTGSPTATPTPTAAPVTATVTLPPIVPGVAPAPIQLPSVGGAGASIQLPANGVTIPPGTTVAATSALGPISTLPFGKGGRSVQDLRSKQLCTGCTGLLYGAITPSNQIAIAGQISTTLTFNSALPGGVNYYIGVFDSSNPGLGPVYAAVGPGTLNASTNSVTFVYNATPANPVILKAGVLYGYVVYYQGTPAPTPTPAPTTAPSGSPTTAPTSAPSGSPTSVPTATPTATPIPNAAPTSIAIAAGSQTATVSLPSSVTLPVGTTLSVNAYSTQPAGFPNLPSGNSGLMWVNFKPSNNVSIAAGGVINVSYNNGAALPSGATFYLASTTIPGTPILGVTPAGTVSGNTVSFAYTAGNAVTLNAGSTYGFVVYYTGGAPTPAPSSAAATLSASNGSVVLPNVQNYTGTFTLANASPAITPVTTVASFNPIAGIPAYPNPNAVFVYYSITPANAITLSGNQTLVFTLPAANFAPPPITFTISAYDSANPSQGYVNQIGGNGIVNATANTVTFNYNFPITLQARQYGFVLLGQ